MRAAPSASHELARLITLCARPAVAIGGIDASNAAAVLAAGARGVAVISALFSASDPRGGGALAPFRHRKVMSGTSASASPRAAFRAYDLRRVRGVEGLDDLVEHGRTEKEIDELGIELRAAPVR